jgi:hypothetical protein
MKNGWIYYASGFFALICVLSACESTPPINPQQKLAGALCECIASTRLIEANHEAQSILSDKSKATQLTALLQTINDEHQKLKTCLEPAVSAFGQVPASQFPQFVEHINKHCPNRDSMLITIAHDWVVQQESE